MSKETESELDADWMGPAIGDISKAPIDGHIGNRLRVKRMHEGVSPEEMARTLGVTSTQLSNYERGATRISARRLFAIAAALDTPIAYFFEGFQNTKSAPSDKTATVEANNRCNEALSDPQLSKIAQIFDRLDMGSRLKLLQYAEGLAGGAAEYGVDFLGALD